MHKAELCLQGIEDGFYVIKDLLSLLLHLFRHITKLSSNYGILRRQVCTYDIYLVSFLEV